ncbi:hypothetical protein PP353_gp69 [Arthrobacter phage Kumotta]|uniref:Uncharacterized protein n=2 Tax=Kumottavirus TaxID=3044749 RepID=A0A4Y6ELI6_9CAUD|nr:hypothetical protein PP353_gp69 [Arthrobacter phage Kumotta]YP_010649547.1 hypothetical protein PP356_gp65 [Arthrobacter phage MargaretKali]AXH44445.1 hypothetical protein SEA_MARGARETKALI_65 [Arthrobacter phage MargaretKali]QDF19578.1 hypothetical protein SEA_KUMOTTA_69 [Arthrobacter phage Kumotta]
MTVRKEGKARWVYECQPCNVDAVYPDQFRAIEHEQRHEKTFAHFGTSIGNAVRETFQPLMDAFGFGKLEPWQEQVFARSLWEDLK